MKSKLKVLFNLKTLLMLCQLCKHFISRKIHCIQLTCLFSPLIWIEFLNLTLFFISLTFKTNQVFFAESESRSVLSDSATQNSPSQNTGVDRLALPQQIFPTQGSNPSLPHCGQILLPVELQCPLDFILSDVS